MPPGERERAAAARARWRLGAGGKRAHRCERPVARRAGGPRAARRTRAAVSAAARRQQLAAVCRVVTDDADGVTALVTLGAQELADATAWWCQATASAVEGDLDPGGEQPHPDLVVLPAPADKALGRSRPGCATARPARSCSPPRSAAASSRPLRASAAYLLLGPFAHGEDRRISGGASTGPSPSGRQALACKRAVAADAARRSASMSSSRNQTSSPRACASPLLRAAARPAVGLAENVQRHGVLELLDRRRGAVGRAVDRQPARRCRARRRAGRAGSPAVPAAARGAGRSGPPA